MAIGLQLDPIEARRFHPFRAIGIICDDPFYVPILGDFGDGTVRRVDPATMTVFTDFESHTAAAINVIPPQKAGWIAERAGVADATGWCPINPLSFASQLQPDIHVIGDAKTPRNLMLAQSEAEEIGRSI